MQSKRILPFGGTNLSFANSWTRVLIRAKSNICVEFQNQLRFSHSWEQGRVSVMKQSPGEPQPGAASPPSAQPWGCADLSPLPFGAQQGKCDSPSLQGRDLCIFGGSTEELIPFLCAVGTWESILVSPCVLLLTQHLKALPWPGI